MRAFAVAIGRLWLMACSLAVYAQTRVQQASVETCGAAAPAWDTALPGKWTCRSHRNQANGMVIANPDPVVEALDQIYGKGEVRTANATMKAFDLVFGEGVMAFDKATGNDIAGVLDMGGGHLLDLAGTMYLTFYGNTAVEIFGNGRAGAPAEAWEYDYETTTTPKWPHARN